MGRTQVEVEVELLDDEDGGVGSGAVRPLRWEAVDDSLLVEHITHQEVPHMVGDVVDLVLLLRQCGHRDFSFQNHKELVCDLVFYAYWLFA